MPNETQTRTAHCPAHGTVQATRELPRPTFPWIINSIRRAYAKRRPFTCPTCGRPVRTD